MAWRSTWKALGDVNGYQAGLPVPTDCVLRGMLALTTVGAAILGCVTIICIERYLKCSRRRLRSFPLPPGPSGLLWVGNVIGIDASAPWLTYSKWAKTYGDLVHSRLLGKDVIIIDSEKVAKDLLERRSRIYSDRPYIITSELCGVDFNTALLRYGDEWRLHRRFLHQSFRRGAVFRFHPVQFRKSCWLLQQLWNAPEQLSEHVFNYTLSVIINSVYDYDPPSRQDELTASVVDMIEVLATAGQPGVALIIEAFPLLLYLPSWFPGMALHKRMAAVKAIATQYVERPFEYSMQRLSEGGLATSLVHDSICKAGRAVTDKIWVKELKCAAATAFLAGSETSNSVIMTFFLMMVLNPEIQEKAQAQIDRVVGENRLPTLDDRPTLPYLDAILREVYRYQPIVPLSIPHSVVDDDVFSGYHIPKGALILTNLWSMAHDERKYAAPDKFHPERFLADDGSLLPNDTEHLAFGFGRRICPGRHLADTTVWSAISSVLAIFHISKVKDANGMEIPVEPKFSTGLSVRPLPFAYTIVPRRPGMDARKLERLITATMVR